MRWQKNLWWFAAPSFLLLAAVMFYPLFSAIRLSVFDYYLVRPNDATFVGLDNYIDLITEGRFWSSLSNTMLIAGGSVLLEFVLGLAVALCLYSLQRGARLFLVLQLFPLIITPVVAALFLKWMFVARWGLIDASLASFDLTGPNWLGSPAWAKLTVILADAWKFTPFMILVLYAGLQSIDRNLIDSGRIDGASGWQLLYHVIIPALRPLILFVLIIRIMDAFRFFDTIYVLTGGGPGTATETLTIYTFSLGFRQLEMGKAAALGVVTLVLVSVLVMATAYLLYRREKGAF
ncbi:MAG: sugar ABC transporter permease [Nitratireductor sp.]|nr:sugar ABC transporter permease [Nitratireductor sp.]